MDPDFWHQRWHEGRIGFHQETVTPMLERHWNAIGAPAGCRVFAPLCGKSLDLAWLAALIALPPDLRQRYAGELYAYLPASCNGLLVTLEYPQQQMAGPPFSVHEDEVRTLFEEDWTVELLERRDILAEQPGFAAEGVSALATAAYRLRHAHP